MESTRGDAIRALRSFLATAKVRTPAQYFSEGYLVRKFSLTLGLVQTELKRAGYVGKMDFQFGMDQMIYRLSAEPVERAAPAGAAVAARPSDGVDVPLASSLGAAVGGMSVALRELWMVEIWPLVEKAAAVERRRWREWVDAWLVQTPEGIVMREGRPVDGSGASGLAHEVAVWLTRKFMAVNAPELLADFDRGANRNPLTGAHITDELPRSSWGDAFDWPVGAAAPAADPARRSAEGVR